MTKIDCKQIRAFRDVTLDEKGMYWLRIITNRGMLFPPGNTKIKHTQICDKAFSKLEEHYFQNNFMDGAGI